METVEEFTKLKMELEIFPNFFQLDSTVKRNAWQNVKNKLLSEREETFDDQSSMEKHRDLNLEAYANFELGDTDKAEKLIADVIDESMNANMNSCAMMTRIQYLNGEFSESKQLLEHLKELMKDQRKVYQAKAELAYAYTRLEARYYDKAINILEEVVTMYPDEFIWKYGLAVPYRRCIHLPVRTLHPELEVKHCFKRAEELLQNIIDDCKLPLYVAKAYIEMANLYAYSGYEKLERNAVIQLINKGVEKAPKIHGILARAGRILRYVCKIDLAKTYLESAIKIRRTSLCCHQLGLVIKGEINHKYHFGVIKWLSNAECSKLNLNPSQKLKNEETSITAPINTQYYRTRSISSPEDAGTNQISFSEMDDNTEIDQPMKSRPSSPFGMMFSTHEDYSETETFLKYSILSNGDPVPLDRYSNLNQDDTMVIGIPEEQRIRQSEQLHDINTGQIVPMNSLGSSEIDEKLTNIDVKTKIEVTPCETVSIKNKVEKQRTDIVSKSKLSSNANEFGSSPVVQKISTTINKKTHAVQKILTSPIKVISYPESALDHLNKCIELFKEAIGKSEGKNEEAMYDLGSTYLQVTPPRYETARKCFSKILNISNSPYMRYKSYEQSGVCLVYMSNAKGISETVKIKHTKDAMQMLKLATECWTKCQTKSFNEPNEYCESYSSFNELVKENNIKDVASLYTIVQSSDLYQEDWEKLELYSSQNNDDIVLEFIHRVIYNSISLGKFYKTLEFLSLLLRGIECLKSKEFVDKVLLKAVKHSIENNDVVLAKIVFVLHIGPQYRSTKTTDDIVIIFEEENGVASACGNMIAHWLNTFCSFELRVTKNSDSVSPNKPTLSSLGEAMANAQMVIFVVTDGDKNREFEYLMDVALTAYCDETRCLSRIFPVNLGATSLPKHLIHFKSLTLPETPSDNNRIVWLKTFSEIYFRSDN